jgi:hypothetical protein
MAEGFSGAPTDEGPGAEEAMRRAVEDLVSNCNNTLASAYLKNAIELGAMFTEAARDNCPCTVHSGMRLANALQCLSAVFASDNSAEQKNAVAAAMMGVIYTSSLQMEEGEKLADAKLQELHEEEQSQEDSNRT